MQIYKLWLTRQAQLAKNSAKFLDSLSQKLYICIFQTISTMQEQSAEPFSLLLDVRDYELDAEGIVNNANYLHYFEHTRHEFCRKAGVSFTELLDRGIVTVVRDIKVTYLKPLRSGDRFESILTLSRRGPRFIFHQIIRKACTAEECARADVTVVALADGRLSRGDELAEIFGKYIN